MRFFLGLILALTACSSQVELQPFSSDGCSLFPDQSLILHADWCDCCVLHDVAYWQGGTAQQRRDADAALRDCVLAKTQDQALAQLMYNGVRMGGSPYFYNWYRWGYGWPYTRKYAPLSDAESQQVKRRWGEFVASAENVSAEPGACPMMPIHELPSF